MATKSDTGLLKGEDGLSRCWWQDGLEDYSAYHDTEWGYPVVDDQRLFEKICLEGFQAGLSWLTILRKRENFRDAFAGFDFSQVSKFGAKDIARLLENAGIIRHRGKIEATINNAQRALEMQDEFGSLAAYFWSHEPALETRPKKMDKATLGTLGQTEASQALSKDLKKRGWKFVGPTTCYAFMQAMGLVNDHLEGCTFRPKVEAARIKFKRPQPR
jgi:DNA-3-methyladenine glycosylase I